MIREGEMPELAEEVAVQVWERNPTVPGFNEQLRESSEIVANVDEGFRHYIKYFRRELLVTAAIRVEKGHHGDYGWGVYFEQGRHRCVLAGTLVDRPEDEIWEDTMWTACAAWRMFEPILGQPKIHQETLWTPDEFGHIFAGDSYAEQYQEASEFRKGMMDSFAAGTRKFAQPYEYHSWAEGEPPKRADGYAYHAASSRRIRISDRPSLWDEGQVDFAPPPSQTVAAPPPSLISGR
jgi:hypothetical protein